jgi:serine/threonine-protein kinase
MAVRPGANTGTVGRYLLHGEIASGGMATVHVGRLVGAAGFGRTVAIKRMHADLAKDPAFISMFVDEARLAASIHHPNVASTLDVVATSSELFVVMEYIHGESLAALMAGMTLAGARMPPRIALCIGCDVLAGLHAAHEAEDENHGPLGIVHRDVSPQNILVGVEGVTRIIDFGVAKAAGRLQTTREGQIKGKISYMSPEQLLGEKVDRRSDVYSASVVLWEMLTGVRLFQGDNQADTMRRVLTGDIPPPSRHSPGLPAEVDAIVLRGLASSARDRFATAHDMAVALEAAAPLGTPREVGSWMKELAADRLRARETTLSEAETAVSDDRAPDGTRSDVVDEGVRLVLRAAPPTPPPSMPRRKPLRRAAWTVGGILIAAGVATFFFVRIARSRASPAAAPTTVILPTVEAASAAPAEPSATSADSPPRTAPSSRAQPSRRGRPALPAPRPSPDCNPPFVVDERGVRSYKRECVAATPPTATSQRPAGP